MAEQADKTKAIAKRPTDKLLDVMNDEGIQAQFKKAMGEHADAFMASVVEVFANDTLLQNCSPAAVVKEALKAATLDVPLNRALGMGYILPFRQKDGSYAPQFIPGYRLFIQLCLRSKEVTKLNADVVYAGQTVKRNTLTGDVEIIGQPTGAAIQGFCAYIELGWGFSKSVYRTKDEVTAHAVRFSKTYDRQKGEFYETSTWKTDFTAMGIKTVLKELLGKWAPLSIKSKLAEILAAEDEDDFEQTSDAEANREALPVGQQPSTQEPQAPEQIKPPF